MIAGRRLLLERGAGKVDVTLAPENTSRSCSSLDAAT
jgi:hypothetical protein